MSTFILIFIILFTLLEINWVPQYGYHQPLHLFGIFFACIFSRFIFFYKNKFEYLNTNWKIAFFFLIIPYVFALGTNNNYWIQGGIAGIFWLLSGLTFTMPLSIKNNNHLKNEIKKIKQFKSKKYLIKHNRKFRDLLESQI